MADGTQPNPASTGIDPDTGVETIDPRSYFAAAKFLESKGDMEGAHAARLEGQHALDAKMGMFDPTSGMEGWKTTAAGLLGGLKENAMGILNMIPGSGVHNADVQQTQEFHKPLANTPGGAAGLFGANLAGGAGEGAAATGLVSRLGALASKLGLGTRLMKIAENPISRGALEGTTQAEVQGDPRTNRWALAGAGTVGGAALPFAARTGAQLLAGIPRTGDADALLGRGVSLTPGLMNPGGAMDKFEQLPIFSWLGLGKARANAQHDFMHALVQDAAPAGANIPKGPMPRMLSDAYDSFAGPNAYGAVKGFPIRTDPKGNPLIMNTPQTDLKSELAAVAKSNVGIITTPATRKGVDNLLGTLYKETKSGPGPWQSEDLLALRKRIRDAKRAITGNDADGPGKLALLSKAEDSVTDVLSSQLPTKAMSILAETDKQYRKYMAIENAAYKSGFKDPTVAQIANEVRRSYGQTVSGKRNFAQRRLNDPFADLTEAGVNTFTTDPLMRTGASNAPSAITLGLLHRFPKAGIPAAGAGLLLGGTQTGRALLGGQTSAQQALAKLALQTNKSLAPITRSLLGKAGIDVSKRVPVNVALSKLRASAQASEDEE